MTIQPVVLTHEDSLGELDDRELVRRVQQADDHSLEELLRRYRPLARRRSRSFFLEGQDNDDMIQEALLGLFKAIRGFDLTRETPFFAFADLCIERQLYTAVKSGNRRKHWPLNSAGSIDHPSYPDGILLADRLVCSGPDEPSTVVISSQEIDAIRVSLLNTLSDMEGRVLALFIDGKSYEEIAAELGSGVKAIDNALQRIRKKVRNHLRERELDEQRVYARSA